MYSLSVVAPIHLSWPRARAGLSKFAASAAPCPPAPMSICISSTKSIDDGSRSSSWTIAFKRASKAPRCDAPAINRPRSRAQIFALRKGSGTSPLSILNAKPSTTAVLPTPGGPVKTGLFFFLLLRTWTSLRISASRPMTGSKAPCSALSTNSIAYRFNASKVSEASSTPAAFAALLVAALTDSIDVPAFGMHFFSGSSSSNAINKCATVPFAPETSRRILL
mmetsp:Transcript_21653/g.56516  ORF Transcript_21653/g.56516 Transcript_21653/m.56516 type:complete len:222 (+) Transcript_21653:1746-2411(+)